jgi:pilus assembly protein CpaB
VAEMDIHPGTALTGRLVRVAAWPRDIIPAQAVSSLKQLQGRVAQIPITKGEPILFTKLAPEGTAAGLGGLLATDMLAVTVKTDAVSGVAGFINPGDRVDVLCEMPVPGESSEHFSRIILQNLKVLSRGQVWDQTAQKKPKEVPTVTLEVTPAQAETLNLATFQGKIRLALRNQLNTAYFSTPGVISSQLASRRAPARQVVGAALAASQKWGSNVQVIRRMKITYAEFERSGHSIRKKSQDQGQNRRLSAAERERAEAIP